MLSKVLDHLSTFLVSDHRPHHWIIHDVGETPRFNKRNVTGRTNELRMRDTSRFDKNAFGSGQNREKKMVRVINRTVIACAPRITIWNFLFAKRTNYASFTSQGSIGLIDLHNCFGRNGLQRRSLRINIG
jgi:hypothetical protein